VVWNYPEISTVVSDVSSMQQLIEDINLANSADPGSLTAQEEEDNKQVRAAYRKFNLCPVIPASLSAMSAGIDAAYLRNL
jgi:predicted aldo/keto reductase-like oxidoreductase